MKVEGTPGLVSRGTHKYLSWFVGRMSSSVLYSHCPILFVFKWESMEGFLHRLVETVNFSFTEEEFLLF